MDKPISQAKLIKAITAKHSLIEEKQERYKSDPNSRPDSLYFHYLNAKLGLLGELRGQIGAGTLDIYIDEDKTDG